jgi:hypothetical protein
MDGCNFFFFFLQDPVKFDRFKGPFGRVLFALEKNLFLLSDPLLTDYVMCIVFDKISMNNVLFSLNYWV